MKEDIDCYHPELAAIGYEVTSDEDTFYNCIAWAAGDQTQWWECYEWGPVNIPGYYWPPGAKFGLELEALKSAFEVIGYHECDTHEFESGFEKVVLYSKDGEWKHAARQLPDGSWTSKMGEWEDIRHSEPGDAAGAVYGAVACYMRRPIP